jgi:hypothetical protein
MKSLHLLGIVLLLVPAFAVAEADRYRFEIILFERAWDSGSEAWPEEPEDLPDTDGYTDLRSLAVGGLELGNEAAALRRQGMSILAHIAWVETPPSLGSEQWHRLDAGRLSGLVRVRRGRFLHLDTDLVLRDAASGQAYPIRHQRRMRSDELHYVDHPKVGLLIRATRLEPTTGTATDQAPAAGT